MKNILKWTLLVIAAIGAILPSAAEDIDIFVGSSAGTADNPNILIILDNTSNWSRQSQKWPDAATQGQSEAKAIKNVIQTLSSSVNVGLMEFVTGSNENGGFIRFAVKPMTDTNKLALSNELDEIYNNINDPDEKTGSNKPYGDLMYDAYNYFAGAASYSPGGTLASKADNDGYTTTYTRFASPLSAATSCARAFIIFIGNNSVLNADTSANLTALAALGGTTTQLGLPNYTTGTASVNTSVGTTSQCYASLGACSTAEFAAQCSGYTQGCSCSAAVASAGAAACPSGTSAYSVIKSTTTTSTTVSTGTPVSTTSYSNTCYSNWSAARSGIESGGDRGTLTCPSTTTSGNATTTYACSYSASNTKSSSGCSSGKEKYLVTQTATPTTTTTTTSSPTYSTLGYTSTCYASAAACSTSDYAAQCTGTGVSCSCGTPTSSTTASCAAGTSKYSVVGTDTYETTTLTGTSTTDTKTYNADEWARFLYQKGVPVSGASNKSITTYTIDVYNAQQNGTFTSLMLSMAKAGGGKYFAAKSEQAIINALKDIMVEIQAVNSTFASTSLPVNATNRAQNENQVFIGMFRPDPDAYPRWFGNLKRYQLINNGGSIELGDANGSLAVNTVTGFVTACATSYWTVDSGSYWSTIGINPSPAGTCDTTNYNAYSDAPDGPQVEKGAVAEMLRLGNNPTSTSTAPTYAVNRTLYTLGSGAFQTFNTTNVSGISSSIVNFIRGQDVNDEKGDTTKTTLTRPSIHGDVIHSRPLPVNYGGSTGVVVYYGANDGVFRSVTANNGKENWGFIAPEFNSKLERLYNNSPRVKYPDQVSGITPTPTARDYFWDGSTGLYQNSDNSKIWIFPTMRRGGRMIYGIDVTSPTAPTYKWKVGCPNAANDTDCVDGFSGIGQTWSTPNVAFIKGYSTSTPVIVVGGGYDTCEDEDDIAPSCATPKGNKVYVINADTGGLIKAFDTTRSVAADISFVDIDSDGYPDYAYAADTGGNIYRISFIDGPTTRNALNSGQWSINKVAYTNGSGRKFLFGPAVFPNSGKVYVAIGSGDRERPLESNYPYQDNVTNRFYVYMDNLSSTASTDLDTMENYTTGTTCNTAMVLPTSSLKGWYMDLTQYGRGEQTVTSALIAGGMVTFSTNRPVTSSNTCSTTLGEARGYWVNLLNGSGAIGVTGTCGGERSSAFVGGGLPPSPVLASGVPISGKPTTVVIGAVQRTGTGASVTISPQEIRPPINSKRKRAYSYTKEGS